MELYQFLLAAALLTCSLVAGFLFAFAVVVMPGIKHLGDYEFLGAMQKIDRVIQNRNPVFIFVFLGSVLLLAAAAITGFSKITGPNRWILVAAAVLYLAGQLFVTGSRNVPLNNKLQTYSIDSMDAAELKAARQTYETPWNRWNAVRAIFSTLTVILLIVLLMRM